MNNDSNSNAKVATIKIMVVLVLLIVILAGGLFAVNTITGGAQLVTLPGADPIVGQATQPMIQKTSSNITLDTSNYSLKDIVYFENNTWLVGRLTTQDNKANDTIVVMQKIGSYYQDVVGPGSSFLSNGVKGLPPDVSSYLTSKGYVYNAD